MSESTEITAAPVPIAGAAPKSALIGYGERGIALSSLEDAYRFAKYVIASRMAPRGFDTPEAVLVAIQFGAELGLAPMAALQNLCIIQGRPSLWGDAVPGICQALVESYKDERIGDPGKDSWGWKITVTRKGRADPISREYTIADAKRAKLWEKRGRDGQDTPWITNPDRMLFMRARTFCFRDAFPDQMRGLRTVEELRDHPEPEKNVTHSLADLEKSP